MVKECFVFGRLCGEMSQNSMYAFWIANWFIFYFIFYLLTGKKIKNPENYPPFQAVNDHGTQINSCLDPLISTNRKLSNSTHKLTAYWGRIKVLMLSTDNIYWKKRKSSLFGIILFKKCLKITHFISFKKPQKLFWLLIN